LRVPWYSSLEWAFAFQFDHDGDVPQAITGLDTRALCNILARRKSCADNRSTTCFQFAGAAIENLSRPRDEYAPTACRAAIVAQIIDQQPARPPRKRRRLALGLGARRDRPSQVPPSMKETLIGKVFRRAQRFLHMGLISSSKALPFPLCGVEDRPSDSTASRPHRVAWPVTSRSIRKRSCVKSSYFGGLARFSCQQARMFRRTDVTSMEPSRSHVSCT